MPPKENKYHGSICLWGILSDHLNSSVPFDLNMHNPYIVAGTWNVGNGPEGWVLNVTLNKYMHNGLDGWVVVQMAII